MSLETLKSGKLIFHTGKIMIGILHQPRHKEPTAGEILIQRLMQERPRVWFDTPKVIPLSRWGRFLAWVRR